MPQDGRRRLGEPWLPESTRFVIRPYSYCEAGFGALLFATLLAAFLYLSGAFGSTRHDRLYAALLAAIWVFFFVSQALRRWRVLGRLLMLAGLALSGVGIVSFFGFVYWTILSR